MEPAWEALPDDIAALRALILHERAERVRLDAEAVRLQSEAAQLEREVARLTALTYALLGRGGDALFLRLVADLGAAEHDDESETCPGHVAQRLPPDARPDHLAHGADDRHRRDPCGPGARGGRRRWCRWRAEAGR